jgi:tight adherence protein C
MSESIALLLDGRVPFQVLLWPVLFGLAGYLLLTSDLFGRPRPDLAERLRRLDVDERLRMEAMGGDRSSLFASPLLEKLLRPIVEDLGKIARALGQRTGVIGVEELERKLRVASPGVEPTHVLGEKLATGVIGLGVVPVMGLLGIHPFGPWPLWTWALGLVVGFLAPDWELDRRLAAQRTAVVMELPAILDLLAIATSAGLALEQALSVVARQSSGVVGTELRRIEREMALTQLTLAEALGRLGDRLATPEVASVVSQLQAAHEQGLPLSHTLAAQADALRERKRLHIVEEGGKASVRMVLPIAVFVLPVLFVVLLLPAAVELMQLGG